MRDPTDSEMSRSAGETSGASSGESEDASAETGAPLPQTESATDRISESVQNVIKAVVGSNRKPPRLFKTLLNGSFLGHPLHPVLTDVPITAWLIAAIFDIIWLINPDSKGKSLLLRTIVEPNIEIWHDIQAGMDEVTFRLRCENQGQQPVDVEWFQPCMRVKQFTGLNQSNYISRCFIFTESGLTTLDRTRRTEEARYRGGQVYVPKGIDENDVNPRPLSPDRPVNNLIGCFSADGKYLLGNAWDKPQELFQGVIVCIHNDPRIGGLKPGEVKKLFGKLYFLKNEPQELLRRYERDFGKQN